MRGLGLSPEQIEARRRYVQAGDVAPILAGKWNEVWRQKKGQAEASLDDVLAVQMGSYTEPFNLAWYEKMTGREVEYYSANELMGEIRHALTGGFTYSNELVVSKRYPWLACNLDAMSTTSKGHRCTLDAKHVGMLNEATILRYSPGCTQQAIVCETDWWALSVFIGNSKWDVVEQECDPFYVADIIEQTREFWRYVERDEEPVDKVEPLQAPKPQPRRITFDLNGGKYSSDGQTLIPLPEWPNWSSEIIDLMEKFERTHGAATANAITREAIKKLVPENAGLITRGKVAVKQDGRGITIVLDDGEK